MKDRAITELCSWCQEPIESSDDRADNVQPFHHECLFRSTMGSLAHLMKICSCFVHGSDAGDPDGMTLREAAQAAFAYWRYSANVIGNAIRVAKIATGEIPHKNKS